MTGWPRHSVNLTLKLGTEPGEKDRIVYTNKGDESGENPGLHVFEITTEITLEILEELISSEGKGFFPKPQNLGTPADTSRLTTLLGLKYEKTIPTSYQKGGYCTFASNRAIRSALILLGEERSKDFHKSFVQKSRMFWLKTVFKVINHTHDKALKQELYFFVYYLKMKILYKKEIKKRGEYGDNLLMKCISTKAKKLLAKETDPKLKKYLEAILKDEVSLFPELTKSQENLLLELFQTITMHAGLKKKK